MPRMVGSSDRPDWPLAVVVGAGGLGTAIARRLGQTHRILLADRDERHASQLCETLRKEGHDAVHFQCDITSDSEVEALAQAAAKTGPTMCIAHVVGLSPSMADFDTIMRVNLAGAKLVADAFEPVVATGGCAIFISSSSAHMRAVSPAIFEILDYPLLPSFLNRLRDELGEEATSANAYMLSKAGLLRLCRQKAAAWGRRRARIVSLSPGLIATPMGAAEFEKSPQKRALLDATPLGREGTMLEISQVVHFLASDLASYISGTDILVDGGLIAALEHSLDD